MSHHTARVIFPRDAHDPPLTMEQIAECHDQALELGNQGLRIASIFIILVAALLGAVMPIVLARQTKLPVPKMTFFVCKFVGTGVIIATAWMHLLAPAVEQLGDRCVKYQWPSMDGYPWALCIPLMTIMVMFFIELIASNLSGDDGGHDHGSDSERELRGNLSEKRSRSPMSPRTDDGESGITLHSTRRLSDQGQDPEPAGGNGSGGALAGQLTAIFILEFGVVFHSIFIGLTLGTTGTDELVVLLIVLVFHQMLEGLGLGSRLAVAPWSKGGRWIPYVLALAFALSTPVGIAAGIGAKPSDAPTQKLVNGIFDSISAGILLYTGLVELLAHEFMFNPQMRRASLRVQLLAFACVAFGVAVMALLAKWA
ncbi:hypothetical protein HIM_05863 [Hirsutella minnesotensis 3608]|uniref:Zinc-regulated transporter 2 n=1 Tax=Hirsutella minnesotensis 3608 TaxID=1043627 RepID=A0A0F7ZJW7_9HYPO|nr:hypothetical protein HIM_05863 [Hirsutella minnesotensis 3608]